jgi:putative transcriptional regulator
MKSKNPDKNWSAMSDTAIVKDICNSFKQMRLKKNLSQKKISEISGLNRVTISRMEAGRAATLLTTVQILRALDKLELLNSFHEESEISPLQLLKMQEKKRQRASQKRKLKLKFKESAK